MMTLTENQKRIYWYATQGYSIKETALALSRSPNTIREQRRRIRKKMMVVSVVQIRVLFDSKVSSKKTTLLLPQNALENHNPPYNIINGYVLHK